MKKFNKKSLALLIVAALLLTITVSGTVAYLVDSTERLVNTFEPTSVTTSTEETFDQQTKSSVVINNTGDIPVYIRVAVVGSWMKDGQVVDDWKPDFEVGADWQQRDGLYYYTKPIPANDKTTDLLGSSITATTQDGAVLTVRVISQAIQAEPTSAVQEAWGFVPGSN